MKTGIMVACPVCQGDMRVKSLSCRACGSELRGDFKPDPLTKLNEAQRQFVILFLQVGGNLKEMERLMGISYPTVRARLGEILTALGVPSHTAKNAPSRHEILELLAEGKLSTEEAARQLSDL